MHFVTLRAFHEQAADFKKRVSPAGEFDLLREGFDALWLGMEGDIERRQRFLTLGSFGTLVALAATEIPALPTPPWRTGSVLAGAAGGAAAATATRRRTIGPPFATARGGAIPIATITASGPIFALEVGKAVDFRRLLRPSGQKMQV